MNEKRKLKPIAGLEDFESISDQTYYVDKTLMIKDLIDYKSVFLFTRPRRFGKTVNMSMIEAFFTCESETDNSIYFKNKDIWKQGKEYIAEFGKHPVISLTFKDMYGMTFEVIKERILYLIENEFLKHQEILNMPNISNAMKDKYIRYRDGNINYGELTFSLNFLCQILSKAYGSKVVVLIDEYDAPIQEGHKKGYYSNIIDLMRGLLSGALKTNKNLFLGVLTGVLRVTKESIFSGLNNIKVFSVLSDRFSKYFGFTQNEVLKIAHYYGCENRMKEIEEWYDGYTFGKTKIYNPWSVMYYFENNFEPMPYWVNTSGNDLIGDILAKCDYKEMEDIKNLYEGKRVFSHINTEITYKDIQENEISVLSFLLVAGYLTTTGRVNEKGYNELAIPNKEVKGVFKSEIYSKVFRINENEAQDFEVALLSSNANSVEESLRKILTKMASYHDTKESFYHGLLIGLLFSISGVYEVVSNREAGDGRYDIMAKPKDRNGKGILIEVKSKGKEETKTLKELSEEGLRQIDEKHYDLGFSPSECFSVLKYGIAFDKKEVSVLGKEEPFKNSQ